MMTLVPDGTFCAIGYNQKFEVQNGVAPYGFTIASGNGFIDFATGVFTSSERGTTVIQVVDSSPTPQTATATITALPVLELVCQIIESELGLPPGRVWVYDQRVDEPTDSDLYVVLKLVGDKIFGSKTDYDGSGSGIDGTQIVNLLSMVDVNIKSRSQQALARRYEVVMALSSDYAKQQMSKNAFFIGQYPTAIRDISALDGASIPYSFNFSINVKYFYKKTNSVPYYDTIAVPTILTNE